tara:strand:+ start:61 stop:309 length:249 start_codon:yes stop_codon:yes gene_type:complete
MAFFVFQSLASKIYFELIDEVTPSHGSLYIPHDDKKSEKQKTSNNNFNNFIFFFAKIHINNDKLNKYKNCSYICYDNEKRSL